MLAKDWELRWDVTTNWYRISFEGDENDLLDCGDSCTALWIHKKKFMLYILKEMAWNVHELYVNKAVNK